MRMTRDQLQACTKKTLLNLARQQGITGWHGMTKDELVSALTSARVPPPVVNPQPPQFMPRVADRGKRLAEAVLLLRRKPPPPAIPRTLPPPRSKSRAASTTSAFRPRDLSAKVPKDLPAGYGKDRIVVMVRDPYWLHCYWELTRQAIQRAEAALGQEWHTAKPILRLLDVSSRDTTSTTETILRDIDIHGGCNNWYLDVANPPCFVPRGHRLSGPQRQVLRAGPLQRRHHAAGRHQRRYR